jgi:chlorite dismutase
MEIMTDEAASGYALWAVLRRDPTRAVAEGGLDEAVANVEAAGVVIRGFYDVSGLKADADLMIWLHGATPETLQWALRELRRSTLLSTLLPTWNAMGVHRDAEFNRSHVPGFLRGERARDWLTVYPFDRSYDWYILDEDDRKRMLADHGRKGAAYRSVVANTVAAFALGDYEWILPMESDELTDLVDMMRALRATEARLHVRNEVPFFTGRRIPTSEVLEVLR